MINFLPTLYFNDQAEEAVNFYISAFKNSKILHVNRYGQIEMDALSRLPEDLRPGPVGAVSVIFFELNGQQFKAVNGGSDFSFRNGTVLEVNCETQEEIDELWIKLSEGGSTEDCGWVRDKFGVYWVVNASKLNTILQGGDEQGAQRVKVALYNMTKVVIADLEAALNKEQ